MTATPSSPILHCRLVRRQEVAERTIAFYFEKPSGWAFKAGQALDMTVLSPPETDAEGNKRAFSIASGPDEAAIMVASRMRDTAFKRVLQTMPLGSAVTIEGPFGNLTLHNNAARAAVILAGGIGITPFRSILIDAARRRLPQRIFLFYSNRRPEDAPFLDELLTLRSENPNYFALLAYVERNDVHDRQLQTIRRAVRDSRRVATCVGFGPRFLHSTGQAYKGGPNSGVFLQLTCDDARDLQVPGHRFSFGVVKAAQARGDFRVLAHGNRRALRVHLGADVRRGLDVLCQAIERVST